MNATEMVPIMPTPSFLEQFWSKVEKRRAGCWPWLGRISTKKEPYGRFYLGGKIYSAHRVAYELTNGPIPDGKQIDHLCRNQSCVNPAHLEAVPLEINVMRGNGPPAVNARMTHCIRGHELTAKRDKRGFRYCRICKKHMAHIRNTKYKTIGDIGLKLARAVLDKENWFPSLPCIQLQKLATEFLKAAGEKP